MSLVTLVPPLVAKADGKHIRLVLLFIPEWMSYGYVSLRESRVRFWCIVDAYHGPLLCMCCSSAALFAICYCFRKCLKGMFRARRCVRSCFKGLRMLCFALFVSLALAGSLTCDGRAP